MGKLSLRTAEDINVISWEFSKKSWENVKLEDCGISKDHQLVKLDPDIISVICGISRILH